MVIAAIDLGEKSLIALTFDTNTRPILYKCPVLKHLNKAYSKQVVNIQEDMEYLQLTNRKIENIKNKQNRRVTHIFNRVVTELFKDLKYNDVDVLVIGRSYYKKDKSELENPYQVNFSIPHGYLISLIKKRAAKRGVRVVVLDEAYTSRASSLDLDDVTLEGIEDRKFKGRRVNRDRYITHEGIRINSDVNSSYNIMRRSGLSTNIDEVLTHYNTIKQAPKPYTKEIVETR